MECRPTTPQRIEEVASQRLVEKFSAEPEGRAREHLLYTSEDDPLEEHSSSGEFPDEPRVAVHTDGDRVVFDLPAGSIELTRAQARQLRTSLTEALTDRVEYLHTVGHHRADGSYVVERRAASSSGHRKVFESFAALSTLYRTLPGEFTADDVGRSGLTGGRRHLVVRHLVEHPAFDCELTSRQPLTVRKCSNTEPSVQCSPARADGGVED